MVNYSVPCPPPHKRTLWKYNLAVIQHIRNSIATTDWEYILRGHPNEMVSIFTKHILGIMKKYIPNRHVTVSCKDSPWITPEVKAALRRNHRAYKTWLKNGKHPGTRHVVNHIQTETIHVIEKAKSNYISDLGRKVSDPKSGQKLFCLFCL